MRNTIFESNIEGLELLQRGKVRDIYAIDNEKLLIVASDRISAFDVVLPDPIPVALNVYDLQGRRRAHIEVGIQGAGLQRAAWDGRDERGVLLAPGIYLLDVEIAAEFKSIRSLHPVGVAY